MHSQHVSIACDNLVLSSTSKLQDQDDGHQPGAPAGKHCSEQTAQLQVACCWGTFSFFPNSEFTGNYLPLRPPAGNCLLPSKEVISLCHGCLPRNTRLLPALISLYVSLPPQPVVFMMTTPGFPLSHPPMPACEILVPLTLPTAMVGKQLYGFLLPPYFARLPDGKQRWGAEWHFTLLMHQDNMKLLGLSGLSCTCGIMSVSSCHHPFTPKDRESVRDTLSFAGRERSCTFK